MRHRFALPDLGEGIAEGEVVEWLVRPGQTVAADDPLVEVATDKVNVVIPSPVAGEVGDLCVAAGEVVPVGTVLLEIATDEPAAAIADGGASDDAPAVATRAPRRTGRETIARRLTEAAAVPVVTNVD
ncbi:MAG TPA: biotin/lipoyl-containing protein, partial [Conexibacter sp.]|nr:biotin/lipoyl-containing protein [Conexibacter sp.]